MGGILLGKEVCVQREILFLAGNVVYDNDGLFLIAGGAGQGEEVIAQVQDVLLSHRVEGLLPAALGYHVSVAREHL